MAAAPATSGARRREIALGLVLLLMMPALVGCGSFQPLYGERADGASVADAWRQVDVEQQTTRPGQLVRNALLAAVPPAREGAGRYVLGFTVREEEEGITTTSRQGAAHKRLIFNVGYELRDKRTGRVLTSGNTFADTSYAVTRQHFADIAARDQARRTLAKVLAQDLRTRVSAWLARHHTR